jgi:hypothetical protein
MSKLSLSFQNCNRFHGVNVTDSMVGSNIGVDLVLLFADDLFRQRIAGQR